MLRVPPAPVPMPAILPTAPMAAPPEIAVDGVTTYSSVQNASVLQERIVIQNALFFGKAKASALPRGPSSRA